MLKDDLQSLLLPYQKRLIEDQSRFIVVEKSRRIGVTFSEAAWSVLRRLTNKIDHFFCSANLDTSKEFLRYCKQWAAVINTLVGSDYIDLNSATSEILTMPNGSRIVTLSSNPTALRGMGGDVTLDEYAFHESAEALFTAAQPVVTWNNASLRIISTHNGVSPFYNMCRDSESNKIPFKHYKITIEDAVRDGLAAKVPGEHNNCATAAERDAAFISYLRSTCLSDDAFKQEYLCEPLSTQSLISPDQYDALTLYPLDSTLDPDKVYNPLYVGIDVGRAKDLTVVWVIEQYENHDAAGAWDRWDYKTVLVKAFKNMTIPVQYAAIKPILQHPSISGIMVDQGTIGRAMSDMLVEDFPFTQPVSFTAPFKACIAERLNGFVQHKKVSLPSDTAIRNDLLSMKRHATHSGSVTYEGSTKDTHCDYFWSCALALEIAASGNNTIFL